MIFKKELLLNKHLNILFFLWIRIIKRVAKNYRVCLRRRWKEFFNAANEFNNPGSKPGIEYRKDILSRKSNANKNSFYKNKAIGKLPEYLPNKPTVVGSRGGIPGIGS